IDRGEWLIEKDDTRFLEHEACEHHALQLPRREAADRSAPEPINAHRSERLAHAPTLVATNCAEDADIPPQSQRHRVGNAARKAAVDLGLLRQVGNCAPIKNSEGKAPLVRLGHAHDGLEDRSLAGSRRPYNY